MTNSKNLTINFPGHEKTESYTGQISKIRYLNSDNGYMVAEFKCNNESTQSFIITGNLGSLALGTWVEIEGYKVTHKKFGEQFNVTKWTITNPNTIEGIIKFLGSGLIKGIGKSTAKKIVNKFGIKTLDILDKNPNRLTEISGIGKIKGRNIVKSWKKHKEVSDIMVFLQGYGIGPLTSYKIYSKYKSETISKIKQNPYCIAGEIWGIGFKTADSIALSMGLKKDSQVRVQSALLYTLEYAQGEGHTCLPMQVLTEEVMKITDSSEDKIEKNIVFLKNSKKIIDEEGNIFIPYMFNYEAFLAKNLRKIQETPYPETRKSPNFSKIKFGSEHFSLVESQIEAVRAAITEKVSIITGGPGTGKTTLIKAIVDIANEMKWEILLAAPTGRAAKRLQQATNHKATTIHRLLEFQPHQGGFTKNGENPLKARLIIIDESSMVDLPLMSNLIKAVPYSSGIVMVGDIYQLPSIGPGTVLKDLIESESFRTIKLKTIFRQAEESAIVRCSHEINSGKWISHGKGNGGDFFFIERENPEDIVELIVNMVKTRIPDSYGIQNNNIQVLTPKHKGVLGTENLNSVLQEKINPFGRSFNWFSGTWKTGDRVLQTKNNYNLNIFNGDMGIITDFSHDTKEFTVDFDGNIIVRPMKELSEMVLAYAISIHKSQGSEYPAVVVPVHTQHSIMLKRNLLYTGVTRAKKLVVLIGTKRAMKLAISNNFQKVRFGLLKERLIKECKNLR